MANYNDVLRIPIAFNLYEQIDSNYLGRILDVPSLPPPDTTPPVIANYSPTPGTQITEDQALSFEVTDDSGAFRRIIIVAYYADTGASEVIHDGDSFYPYFSAESSRVAITDGFRYTVKRVRGWPASPTIKTFPFDQSGNEGA